MRYLRAAGFRRPAAASIRPTATVSDLHRLSHGCRAPLCRLSWVGLHQGRKFVRWGSGEPHGSAAVIEKSLILSKQFLCFCGWPSKLLVAKTPNNRGKKFYACGNKKRCKFFRWHDATDEMTVPSCKEASRNIELKVDNSSPSPNCYCGKPAIINITQSLKFSSRHQLYVCSSRSCSFHQWTDDFKPQTDSSDSLPVITESVVAENSTTEEHQPQTQENVDDFAPTPVCTDNTISGDALNPPEPPPNKYAMQSEATLLQSIARLQALCSDNAFLDRLPDKGRFLRMTLEEHLDALAYKKKYPDPSNRPSLDSGFEVDWSGSEVDWSGVFKADWQGEFSERVRLPSGGKLDLRYLANLDYAALYESLAKKSNVKNIAVSDKLQSKLYPHQQLCFSWMCEREQGVRKEGDPRGGIVADDMGLGKTIQMIALMLSSMPSDSNMEAKPSSASRGTLIVCPLALTNQWYQEIQRHTFPDSLRVHIHHGANQLEEVKDATDFDVVITTYQTLLSSYSRQGLLHDIHWFRIILDEAHIIKNHERETAKAVFKLDAQTRWFLSATPMQNHLRELFSAFKFLRYVPFCEEEEWTKLFGTLGPAIVSSAYKASKFKNSEDKGSKGLQRLHPVLKGIMIRRTTQDKDENGNPLIVLPEKFITIHRLKFRQKDKLLYARIWQMYQQLIERNPFNYFLGILRLRQACNCMLDEGFVRRMASRLGLKKSFAVGGDEHSQRKGTRSLCGAVLTQHETYTEDPSHGQFDGPSSCSTDRTFDSDIGEEYEGWDTTTDCHSNDSDDGEDYRPWEDTDTIDFDANTSDGANLETAGSPIGNLGNIDSQVVWERNQEFDLSSFRGSPKMEFLLDNLKRIRRESPDEKVVVFSQWTTMLNYVESCLNAEGICSARMDGSYSSRDRQIAVNEFQTNPDIFVFLLSLKSAGLGLNLTAANHCFMLDSWWNFPVEDQAYGRIYRIGQTRPVHIHKLIVEETIEEGVLDLQRHKQAVADSLINSESAVPALTPEELQNLMNRPAKH